MLKTKPDILLMFDNCLFLKSLKIMTQLCYICPVFKTFTQLFALENSLYRLFSFTKSRSNSFTVVFKCLGEIPVFKFDGKDNGQDLHLITQNSYRSQGNVVGIAAGYGLDN
jgi:hypothetical protein